MNSTKQFTIQLGDERQTIEFFANAWKMSLSATIRRIILEYKQLTDGENK